MSIFTQSLECASFRQREMQNQQIVAQQIEGNKPTSTNYIYCFMAKP